MHAIRAILLVISLAGASPLMAQATPEQIVNSVLEDLKKGDAEMLIESLLSKAPLIEVGAIEKANLIKNIDGYLTSYGNLEGWELIRSQNASTRFLQQKYIIFQEKYALSFKISFYESKIGWTITAFEFEDKLDELLNDSWNEKLNQSIDD